MLSDALLRNFREKVNFDLFTLKKSDSGCAVRSSEDYWRVLSEKFKVSRRYSAD
jgi:hypothetical protein